MAYLATLLRQLIGRYRLSWGWCPACKSSAPKLDTCEVCQGDRDLMYRIGNDDSGRAYDVVWERFERRGYR